MPAVKTLPRNISTHFLWHCWLVG